MTFAATDAYYGRLQPSGGSRTMSGRILLLAALTAPALAGCAGLGESATPNPVVSHRRRPPPCAADLSRRRRRPCRPRRARQRSQRRRRRRQFRPARRSAAFSAGRSAPTLTDADRQAAWQAQIAALDSGQRRSWRGAHGVFGFVEPGAETGAGCRALRADHLCRRTAEPRSGGRLQATGRRLEDDELAFLRDLGLFLR